MSEGCEGCRGWTQTLRGGGKKNPGKFTSSHFYSPIPPKSFVPRECRRPRREESEINFRWCVDYLRVEIGKGNLKWKGRQKVVDDFTKETKYHFDVNRIHTWDVNRIHTWVRNHKIKRKGGGKGTRVVLKVSDISHLSHKEIVLVTNDDDILPYKRWHTDYVTEM